MENKISSNLNMTYDWFCNTIGKKVIEAVNTYFENNFTISLASINEYESLKEDPLLKGELFYSCRMPIKNKQHITLRVTSDFIRINFHDILGSSSPVFDLEKLSDLETRILNGLFEFIMKNIEEYLIKDTEQDKINPLNKICLNFDFLIKSKDVNAGKLNINIPLNRLSPKNIVRVQNFTNEDFIHNFAYVDLIAGYAKISLNDLKTLNPDDILILEKSDIKTLTLKTPTIKTDIKVNPEPSIMLNFDDMEEDEVQDNERIEHKEYDMMENKTMWDDIQIEVSAEFKRVKMTLGDLKQISKGLVIDLGPVMNSEISLLVENKTVAKGELVIINDKYGVKITDVFASKKPQEQPQPKPNQASAAKAPSAPIDNNNPPPRPIPSKAPQRPTPPQGAPRPVNNNGQAPHAPQPKPVQPQPRPAQPQAKQPQPKPNNEAPKDDLDYSNFEE